MGRTKQLSDDALLETAREVFVEQGFGASTREIAMRAGISEAVLYQRHRTKIDLFFAAMIPPPFLAGPAPGPQHRSVVFALEAIAIEVMAYFRRIMPLLMHLVTHPSFSLDELVERKAELPLHDLHHAVAACLEEQRKRGAITADRRAMDAAAVTLLATLHSLAIFERMGIHGGAVTDRAIRDIVGLLVRGLGAKKGTSR